MGLTLEEINAKFGDEVEVELKDVIDSQKNQTVETPNNEKSL